nr:uncharacterized protein LOC127304861 [Lolium perenne]
MALRSLVRKMPALGLRSPAGPPVHAPSPAAASRRILPHARPDPSPRLNKLFEKLDQTRANEEKVYNEARAVIRNSRDKSYKQLKALAYGINGLSVYMVIRECITQCA